MGTAVVENIVRERTARGPFSHFYSFFQRMDIRKVGKKAIEHLVEAGCFDSMGWSRDALKASIEPMFEAAAKEREERDQGVMTLFSRMKGGGKTLFTQPPEVLEPTPIEQMYIREKVLLGFFLTGNPLDPYKKWFSTLSCVLLRALEHVPHDFLFRTAVWVETIEVRVAASTQKKFAILTLADGTDNVESMIWSDLYEANRALLQENQLLYLIMRMDRREGKVKLHTVWMADLTRVDEAMIQEADRAYEAASAQAQRTPAKTTKQGSSSTSFRAKAPTSGSVSASTIPIKRVTEVTTMPCYTIALDIEAVRLSHFLQMTEWFQEHPGKSTVRLSFHAPHKGNEAIAYVHVDPAIQVAAEEPLLEEIAEFA